MIGCFHAYYGFSLVIWLTLLLLKDFEIIKLNGGNDKMFVLC
jgi:hypothetical protein